MPKKKGGSRLGAGRPLVYSLMERMAIMLRVSEIQNERECTRIAALRVLANGGEIPPGSEKTIQRYLTPKHLNRDISRVLSSSQREGIVTLIDRPSPKRTKKV